MVGRGGKPEIVPVEARIVRGRSRRVMRRVRGVMFGFFGGGLGFGGKKGLGLEGTRVSNECG